MQINRSNATVARPTYKVQNVPGPDLMDTKNLPLKAAPALPTASPAAPSNGPDLGGLVGGYLKQVALAVVSPPLAIANLVGTAVTSLLGFFSKQPEQQAAPAPQPAAAPEKPAVSAGDRRRLQAAFKELDEDGNGKLEGDELKNNTLLSFDGDADEGMTASEFVDEVSAMDGQADITASAVKDASLKGRIFKLMTEVWGTDAYCNDTSYKWWKGQLKTVNGDLDRLRTVMEDYKKGIGH